MKGRLYRSQKDRMLGGVCGGLGQYLGVDTTLVRLVFVILALAGGGTGFLIYILLWVIIPKEGQGEVASEEVVRSGADEIAQAARNLGEELRGGLHTPGSQTGLLIGASLVVMGAIFMARNLHVPGFWWVDSDVLWPLLLIVGGVILIQRRTKGG